MCGIAGIVGQSDKQILIKMTDTIAYRGPDDKGYFFDAENNVGFGHRRLSVIDLKTGVQPIFNEEKSIAIVFNGEIYNFLELKKQLAGRHKFYTHTDTEVIIHLYEEKGEEFIHDLSGMFTIALWDIKNKKLILARDRFGEKPLYYAQFSNCFIFASELKAILAHPAAKKEIDEQSLEKYLVFEYVPGPQTIFKNIYKLPAGHMLIWQNGKYGINKYWDIFEASQKIKDSTEDLSEQEILKITDEKINQSVKKMLMADVPIGIFLSGGIDSTTIAYYAQKNSGQRINTFCIGFGEKSFDESKYSKIAAARINTNHHLKIFNSSELLDCLPEVYSRLDEPMADPSLLPTFLLSRYARQNVKVALGGDAGDELFMGYPTFQAQKLASFFKIIPKFIRNRLLRPLVLNLPTSYGYMSFDFRLKKFINYFDYPLAIRNQLWIGAFDEIDLKKILDHQPKDLFKQIEEADNRLLQKDEYQCLSYFYLKHYLQEQILAKVDRASMYNSLEVRAPYLDHDLATWLFSLPTNYKLRGWQTKYLLKKLMAPKIGSDLAYRKKHGFQPPVAHWLKNELQMMLEQYLNKKRITQDGIFDSNHIEQLKKEHLSGKADHRKKLWALLVFSLWKHSWLKN